MEHTFSERVVTTLANGHRLALPVHTYSGTTPGPRLGIVAGIHGDEPVAVEIVRRFLEAVGKEEVKGRITAVPVANPYAHMALTRNTPLDGENLNRVFPGNAAGTVTEQVAAALLDLFVGNVDYVIDYHSGGMTACVDYSYLGSDLGLTRAYGTRLLYRGSGYHGTFTSAFQDAGIPTLVSELGGACARIDHYLNQGVAGSLNVARYLGMIGGSPTPRDDQVIITNLQNIRPTVGGIMLSEYGPEHLGTDLEIPGGSVLGRVVSPCTFEELEVLTAPFERTLLVLTRPSYTNVDPGAYGFMVADGATGEKL